VEGGGAHDAESGPEQVNGPSSFGVVQTHFVLVHIFSPLFSHPFRPGSHHLRSEDWVLEKISFEGIVEILHCVYFFPDYCDYAVGISSSATYPLRVMFA
jgi:hypothetical protein